MCHNDRVASTHKSLLNAIQFHSDRLIFVLNSLIICHKIEYIVGLVAVNASSTHACGEKKASNALGYTHIDIVVLFRDQS